MSVSWQTPMLFRVEHARRDLAAARKRAAEVARFAREQQERIRLAEEQDRVWRERQAAARAWQKAAAAHGLPRNRWIYLQRLKGRTQTSIAEEVGLSQAMVGIVCRREARLEEKRKARLQKTWLTNDGSKGRPIDMGGPRGVWLNYHLGDRAA